MLFVYEGMYVCCLCMKARMYEVHTLNVTLYVWRKGPCASFKCSEA